MSLHAHADGGVDHGLSPDAVPDVTRPDARHIMLSEWVMDGPEQQRAAMDGTIDAWERHPLPEAFLSRYCLEGTDGRGILNYAQWSDPEEHRAFARDEANQKLARAIGAAAGEVSGPGRYELYRSMTHAPGGPEARPVTGCVVGITFDTDGHDSARTLIDALLQRLERVRPHPGAIASHCHIRTDGTRIFNFTEWTRPEAHQEVFERDVEGGGDVMEIIRSVPGVRPLGFKRYLPYRGLARR